ncbi:MAG: EamA family transporter [Lautropia mirabilis]
MERWVLYATLSMLFAGFTSVIAKMGMEGISAELGLSVRTLFVCGFVFVFALMFVDPTELPRLNGRSLMWLGISGATTALSWIFYYKAIKEGQVATVALIDKGSVVVAMILAWILLREAITPRMAIGATLIVSGLLVMVRR